jgi:EAL domain-containing protein (putative c-di-GMP-specific phosphodiesterase class I)
MGLGKDWPWLVGTALLVGVGLSIAAFALGSGTTTVTMLSVALIAMALAQLVALMRYHLSAGHVERLAEGQTEIAAATLNLSNENRRIGAEHQNLVLGLEQMRQSALQQNAQLSEGFTVLRDSHESLAGSLKDILDSQRNIQDQLRAAPAPSAHQHAMEQAMLREQDWMAQLADMEQQSKNQDEPPPQTTAAIQSPAITDALTLSLEPVVDLFTSNTAHYRLVLGMTNEQGKDVAHEVFLHHADRLGQRAALDVHVVRETLDLLAQLRQRDPGLCVFVPLGVQTLGTPHALATVLQSLADHPAVAAGLVAEVPHAMLANLPDSALEGIATLARAGVALGLAEASVAGLDLAALNRLNVRFISLAAASVGVGSQMAAGLPGLIQSARALRIQTIISQVVDPRHVPGLARSVRYASGPAFALPRKLKRAVPNADIAQAA